MSGSGSNLREAEVPEEEIDEDYEDEKTEEESGMGSMVAGGAGLVLLIIAGVVVYFACCRGESAVDSSPSKSPESPSVGTEVPAVDTEPVEGSSTGDAEEPTTSQKLTGSAQSKSGSSSSTVSAKGVAAVKDFAGKVGGSSRKYGDSSKNAVKTSSKSSIMALGGCLMAIFSAVFLLIPNNKYSTQTLGGQPLLSGKYIMGGVGVLGALCCFSSVFYVARNAPGEEKTD